jgi:hypothetical protein
MQEVLVAISLVRRWSSVKRRRRPPELSPQDAILFAQVFDRFPLLLVHPDRRPSEDSSVIIPYKAPGSMQVLTRSIQKLH